MKIKSAPAKREKRPNPLSFRFSNDSVRKLHALAKVTNKSQTEILEELIEAGHRDTIKK